MKTKNLLFAVLLAAVPLSGFAQEWDDIYADPSRSREERKAQTKKQEQPPKKKVVIVQGEAPGMEVIANGRDIDEYNRRGTNDTTRLDEEGYINDYEEYEYTDRIVRFHDPESSIKITGADEVIVYVGNDIYENYNNRGWSSFYTWYDPWYYSGWYSPFYYSRWHSPWYYGAWGYGWWYNPWYYGPWGYGWNSLWYSRYWFDPWYFGGWYDPWYYGSWYGNMYYGYGSGYYHGFSDGYYSSLTRNRSGRSSGVYRTSSASRTSSSAMASLSGRSSTLSGRSSGATRTTVSGRSASALTNRGSTTASRTRIIDSSGRTYDARTGVAIDRSDRKSVV